MSNLLEDCRSLFGTDDLYELLNVARTATQNQLKKAYHKVSLKVHPDRVGSKEKTAATSKFQTLGKVYSILSDNDRRALYDESGEVDDEDDVTMDRDWSEYWRLLFPAVSLKDIKKFEKKYQGSKEELSDLKAAYLEHEGDMDAILDHVMCCTVDDEPRFSDIIKGWIQAKEVPAYKGFTKEKKTKKKERKAKADEEAREAEKARKNLGMDQTDSLRAMILQKHKSREKEMDGFFKHLEEKYCVEEEPVPKKRGRKK